LSYHAECPSKPCGLTCSFKIEAGPSSLLAKRVLGVFEVKEKRSAVGAVNIRPKERMTVCPRGSPGEYRERKRASVRAGSVIRGIDSPIVTNR